MKYRLFYRIVGVIMTTLAVNIVLTSPKTNAIEINTPNIPVQWQGHNDEDYRQCDYSRTDRIFTAALSQWITEQGNSAGGNQIPVAAGQDSVNLQINLMGHNCTSNMSLGSASPSNWPSAQLVDRGLVQSRANIQDVRTSMGNITNNPAGTSNDINFSATYSTSPPYDKFYTNVTSVPFTLSGLSGLGPGNYRITVTADIRWVNQYGSNNFVCVAPPPPPAVLSVDGLNGGNCGFASPTFEVIVTIPGNPGTVSGRVYNYDNPSEGFAGITIVTCDLNRSTTTDANGNYTFSGVAALSNFCVRVQSAPPSGFTGPNIRPSGQGYGASNNGATGNCAASASPPCPQSSYEWQVSQADCYQNVTYCGAGKTGGNDNVRIFDRGADSGFDFVFRSSPTSCPGQPTPPYQTVTLPATYNEPNYGGSIMWGAPGPTRTTTMTDYTSHEDISDSNWGGGDVMPLLVSDNPGNPGSVTLDYSPYISEYPFDYNQPRVYYDDTYTTYYYGLDGPAYVPIYEERQGSYWYDPDGSGPQQGYMVYYTYYEIVGYEQIGYYVVVTGTSSTTEGGKTTLGPLMNPCFDRTYTTTGVSFGQPTLTPDRENPTEAPMNGATINLQFGVTQPGRGRADMRQASRANNLPYQIQYQVVRSGTGPTPFGWVTRPSTPSPLTVVAYSSAQNATGSGAVSVTVPLNISVEQSALDMRVGDMVCWRVIVSETQGNIRVDGSRYSASGQLAPEQCSLPVVNWPYVEVYGNDVVSGGSFAGGCLYPGLGIRTFNRQGQNRGSSSQYAAFAIASINGFSSASLRNGAGSPASAPVGLTFANTTGGDGGGYAANDGLACMPDYFGSKPSTGVTTLPSPAAVNAEFSQPNPDPNQLQYYETGSLTLNGLSLVSNGVRKVFYVDGTLTINNNLMYQMAPAWTNRDEVPLVVFIARDVNIGPGASQIDGVYIAQPGNGGTGTITTCSPVSYDACRNGLLVNGAFVAERVNFYRTRGSLRNAQVNEGRLGVSPGVNGNNLCSVPFGQIQTPSLFGTAGGATCAAEVFSFSPEIYLGLSQVLTPKDNFILDSYVNLPPNL